MTGALKIAAVGEIATGLALLFVPSFAASLLLGQGLDGFAVPVARVLGLALIGLGLACWPGSQLLGMLVYSTTVAGYLAYLGAAGIATGSFLWPAVVVHVILTVLLSRAVMRDGQ